MEKLGNSWDEFAYTRQAGILSKMALNVDPQEKEAYYRLALKHLDAAIEQNPNYINSHVKKAHILEHLGDYEEALSCFESIDLEEVNDLSLYLDKGRLYTKMGDVEEGIRYFDFAISLAPTFTDAYIEKADAFFSIGDVQRATECYEAWLKIEDGND
jgi:tetratricopeptide (TPR) repeat protein